MKTGSRTSRALLLALVSLFFLSAGGGVAKDRPRQALEDREPGSFIRGAVLDAERHELPERAVLSTDAYRNLPPAVSLKKFAPVPGDQSPYGTCVAWAAAYGLRTISESVIRGQSETRTITGMAYSPVFVYKSVSGDPGCLSGMQIFAALDLMRDRGTPRMLDAELRSDFRKVPLEDFAGARLYTIEDYVTLFRTERPGRGNSGPGHVLTVKKSLSERKPVIIGMNTPESFVHAVNFWQPRENPRTYYGGHSVVVIGYDDSRYGGAFEILNSWGKKWGNSGFMWIPYDVFGQWVREAYEIIENLAVWSDTSRFSGTLRILVPAGNGDTGDGAAGDEAGSVLPARLAENGYYRAGIPEGTGRYRILLDNTDPAWICVFRIRGEAGRTRVWRLFPPENSSVVPVLDYGESLLALPGDSEWIQEKGDSTGTEYLALFYSKHGLNATQIRARLEKSSGTIREMVSLAAGPGVLEPERAEYAGEEIRFSVESKNPQGVYTLIVEL